MRADPKGAAARAPQDLLSSLKPGRPPAGGAFPLRKLQEKGCWCRCCQQRQLPPLAEPRSLSQQAACG